MNSRLDPILDFPPQDAEEQYQATMEEWGWGDAKRKQQIKAIDLIASWRTGRPEQEIGTALSQWVMAGEARSIWAVFEAALEDMNYSSLIPVLKQAWNQWEIEDDIKQAEFEAMMSWQTPPNVWGDYLKKENRRTIYD